MYIFTFRIKLRLNANSIIVTYSDMKPMICLRSYHT